MQPPSFTQTATSRPFSLWPFINFRSTSPAYPNLPPHHESTQPSNTLSLEPVRIQVLSDLHLELSRVSSLPYFFDFPVKADTLALLGDIGLTHDDRLFDWLRAQLRRFKLVFFCPAPNTSDVLNKLFTKLPAELGKIGNYEQCAFLTPGTGQ